MNPNVRTLNAEQMPQTQIGIALDTAYLESLPPGQQPNTGIFMMDNRSANGSRNEGEMELSTSCYAGDRVSFFAVPIDPTRGDTIEILGFNVTAGNVFGGSIGNPKSTANPAYWIGRAVNSGAQTYNIQILLTDSSNNQYVINWDPYINCQ